MSPIIHIMNINLEAHSLKNPAKLNTMTDSNGLPDKLGSFIFIKKSVLFIALIVVTIMSAMVTGWMIGQSGLNSTVIAAVLPAFLSAGWGVILFKFATMDSNNPDMRLFTIILAMTLFLIFLRGAIEESYAAKVKADDLLSKKLMEQKESRFNLSYFEECSRKERQVNKIRQAIELTPLQSEYFCSE